ncbi:hypothetical protein Bca101_026683 [Brassica carinata]
MNLVSGLWVALGTTTVLLEKIGSGEAEVFMAEKLAGGRGCCFLHERTRGVSRSFFFGRVEDDVAITVLDFGLILMFYQGLSCNNLIPDCNAH